MCIERWDMEDGRMKDDNFYAVVLGGVFVLILTIVFLLSYFENRRLDLIQQLIDKGMPVPEEIKP